MQNGVHRDWTRKTGPTGDSSGPIMSIFVCSKCMQYMGAQPGAIGIQRERPVILISTN